MVNYDDYDDYDDSNNKYSSSGGGPFCMPVTVYLSVAVISLIVYFGVYMMKGSFPKMQTVCSVMCSTLILTVVLSALCYTKPMLAWCFSVMFSVCAICFAMGKVPTFGLLK